MFRDRLDAGRQLAGLLDGGDPAAALVLALPRGGVPVAAEVASVLEAPLDVLVVRKVGVPWHQELALGAVGEGGISVVNDRVAEVSGIDGAELESLVHRAMDEVERLAAELRHGAPRCEVAGRPVVVVDDGVATGATARAAAAVLRAQGAGPITLATPVLPRDTLELMESTWDDVVYLRAPRRFGSVGQFYEQFGQVSTEEVRQILERQTS